MPSSRLSTASLSGVVRAFAYHRYFRFFLSLFFSTPLNEFFQIQAYLISDFDCWLCYFRYFLYPLLRQWRVVTNEGCSTAVERVIVSLVKFIELEEKRRGQIARTERSHLAEDAEKCQVVLDKVMLVLLGLGDDKHDYIRTRLREML